MAAPSKYQKGEERYILRSQIKEAPYNPRVIGEGAEKRLRKMIKSMGLLGTLIWNERSGTLVSGHQRLKQLDVLEGYPDKKPDYDVRVTAVDLSEKEEKEANVFMNNPSTQGEWDYDRLAGLILDDGITADGMGFTEADLNVMFGGDPRFDALFNLPDTEEVAATKEQIREVRDHRAASTEKMQEEQNAEFFFTVICQNQKAKADLLKHLGLPAHENFVNGAIIARKVGVPHDAD
jgi:hypothetical protein